MGVTKIKYFSGHRKHGYELVDEAKEQPNAIFIPKKIANKVINDCRTTVTHKFGTILGFKQYDVILTIIKNLFEGENMQTQHIVLRYRIHLFFDNYIPAIEIDETGHSDKNIGYEMRGKNVEQECGCVFE